MKKGEERISSQPLVEAVSLSRRYTASGATRTSVIRAVDDVSLSIMAGQTFGLVGQTGSGKSTLGRMLVGLEVPSSGSVLFDGADMGRQRGSALRSLRKRMQIVFQDPIASLNRRKNVRAIVGFPLKVHGVARLDRNDRVDELLEMVGLSPEHASSVPGELSGGQCQRVSIARALALRPEFVVLDEPVSSLDVSIQAQILNLLRRLQDELNLTYLFISHDLSIVRYMSGYVAVMRRGKIVEEGRREDVFDTPSASYTKELLEAIPDLPGEGEQRLRISADTIDGTEQ